MSKLIDITVTDKIARLTDKSSKIVCNNSDYKVVFHFDDEWSRFPLKTAVIEYGKYRETRIFEGNECELPPIVKARVAKVGVFAGEIHTTTPAVIECEKSILDGEGLPPDPAPDVYTQLMKMMKELQDKAVSDEEVQEAVNKYLSENPVEVSSLPEVTEEDNGKVLAVSGGEWVPQEITIPDVGEPEPELPEVSEADDGKVLVVENGEWVAQEITIPDAVEELDAEKVKFSSDLTTTVAIGNITLSKGQATIPAKGKNLKQVWDTIFVKEKNPSTTPPSVSITFDQDEAYEVGTKIVPTYSASLNAGSYTYGPSTGVTATKWTVTDSRKETKSTASGKFSELQITDETNYTIKAEATHTAGAMPVTNTGNEYSAGKIAAGTKSKTSGAATGYRNSFYGTLGNKNTLTSDVIRGLTKSGKALANGDTFTVPVPVGALRVVIAYPATLKDVASIQDENSAYFNIAASFASQTMDVNGENNYTAKSYKVYTLDFASANEKANNFIVTI